MKKLYLAIILFLITELCFSQNLLVPGKELYVIDNLHLRTEESTKSEIITTIGINAKVLIIQIGKEDIIDGIKSNWVKIQIGASTKDNENNWIPKYTEGWCYGGFLSESLNPNVKNEMFYFNTIMDFLENPFLEGSKFPDIFSNFTEFKSYFNNCTLKTEDVYDNKNTPYAQKIIIHKGDIILHYWRNMGALETVLLQMTEILPKNKNLLKHNIHLGMKKNEIISIFGNDYWTNKFTTNYEICYDGDGLKVLEQVNFLFDYNNNLINIIIHSYMG